MILINIKMPIRPEKMDQWIALAPSASADVVCEPHVLTAGLSRFGVRRAYRDARNGTVARPGVTPVHGWRTDESGKPDVIMVIGHARARSYACGGSHFLDRNP